MLQNALHERRIWRHFGGQPSHELTDAAAKRIPETESTAKTPPFRTPWESRFNPNGNRSRHWDGDRSIGAVAEPRLTATLVVLAGWRYRRLCGSVVCWLTPENAAGRWRSTAIVHKDATPHIECPELPLATTVASG
jgi:hypothetical protein